MSLSNVVECCYRNIPSENHSQALDALNIFKKKWKSPKKKAATWKDFHRFLMVHIAPYDRLIWSQEINDCWQKEIKLYNKKINWLNKHLDSLVSKDFTKKDVNNAYNSVFKKHGFPTNFLELVTNVLKTYNESSK